MACSEDFLTGLVEILIVVGSYITKEVKTENATQAKVNIYTVGARALVEFGAVGIMEFVSEVCLLGSRERGRSIIPHRFRFSGKK